MQQYADIYLLQSHFAVNICILVHLVGFLLILYCRIYVISLGLGVGDLAFKSYPSYNFISCYSKALQIFSAFVTFQEEYFALALTRVSKLVVEL